MPILFHFREIKGPCYFVNLNILVSISLLAVVFLLCLSFKKYQVNFKTYIY